MAQGINKAILIGNLGADPEIRYTQAGDAVATFSIATSETWTKDGEKHEKTEWHKIVAWRKLAEICGEYLRKGSQVYIEGKIEYRKYTDRDGNERNTTEINARNMTMLGRREEGSAGHLEHPRDDQPAAASGGSPASITDDDIPF